MGAGLSTGVGSERLAAEERRMRGVFVALAQQSSSEGERGSATLDKTAFLRFFSFLPGMLGERLFAVFDRNASGAIDFEEFFQGMVRIYAGSMDEKRKFLFDMYDLDGDGVVTSEELVTLLATAAVPPSLTATASLIGGTAGRDSLSFSEFCLLLEKSPVVSALLNIFHHDTVQALFEAVNAVCPMCNASVLFRFCSVCGLRRAASPSQPADTGACTGCQTPLIPQPPNFCLLCGHSLRSPLSPRAPSSLAAPAVRHSWAQRELQPVDGGTRNSRRHCCLPNIGRGRARTQKRERVQCELRDSVPFLYVAGEPVFLRGCEFESVDSDISSQAQYFRFGVHIRRLDGGGRAAAVSLYWEKKDEREVWLDSLQRAGMARRLEDFYTVDWTRELGRGKFGQVFLGRAATATATATGEEVAVKSIGRSEQQQEREFLRAEMAVGTLLAVSLSQQSAEAHAAATVPIVRIFDIFETSETIFVVMEYMRDGDLLNYLLGKENKRLDNSEAALAVDCVLQALEFLHSRGVTHRDVKIENCLVTLDTASRRLKTVALTDFGLAALSAHGKSMSESLGTVAYASPEVILHQKYDRSVDLWGVGCLLYVLLSGKLPFAGRNDEEIANAVTKVKLHFPGDFWDPDAVHLIKHLLVRNPKHRVSLSDAKSHPWLGKYRQQEQPLK